jgi:hypothetical protein
MEKKKEKRKMKSIYKKEEKENIIITVTPELMPCSIHLKEP